MARFFAVVLLLTLALVPAVSAEPQGQEESPFVGWLSALRGALDRVFSWIPALRPESRIDGSPSVRYAPHGAMIVPNGIATAPRNSGAMIVPNGVAAVTGRSGAMIVPNGVQSNPGSLEDRRLRVR